MGGMGGCEVLLQVQNCIGILLWLIGRCQPCAPDRVSCGSGNSTPCFQQHACCLAMLYMHVLLCLNRLQQDAMHEAV